MTSSEPGVEFLLDTNILIYMALEDETVKQMMRDMKDRSFGISIISLMEALMGVGSQEEQDIMDAIVEPMMIVSMTETVARRGANVLRNREKRSVRDPLFADTIIAHTAIELGIPLVTNNPKDFAHFQGLKLLTPGEKT